MGRDKRWLLLFRSKEELRNLRDILKYMRQKTKLNTSSIITLCVKYCIKNEDKFIKYIKGHYDEQNRND